MKAVVARGVGPASELRVATVPDPAPAASQVLVAVGACGVCFHDVLSRRGSFPRTRFPAIFGHEIAGEVVAVGEGVRGLAEGDRVASIQLQPCGRCRACLTGRDGLCRDGAGFFGEEGPGGYAELVAGDANAFVRLPSDVDDTAGAILACAVGTALHAVRTRAAVRLGDTVVITGASGGVGAHAVQLARLAGARVIAVTSAAHKADRLADLGAHDVVVSADLRFDEEVKRLTHGDGADVVIEIVGARTYPASVRCLRAGGRLVFVGNVTGEPVSVAPALLILKELSLSGSVACGRQELSDVIGLVRSGQIVPVIDRVLPLAQAADAHELLESGGVEGRVVLVP